MATKPERIAEIRKYAEEHYEEGWDVVVEAYDDEMIWDVVRGAKWLSTALKRFAPMIDAHEEKIAMAKAEAF